MTSGPTKGLVMFSVTSWLFVASSGLLAGEKPAEPKDGAGAAFFRAEVEPILKKRCLKCHGAEPKVRGNLRLDSRESIFKGGDQGPAASIEKPEESLILLAVRYEGMEMPPTGRLPQAEIDVLTRWVKDGLHWPVTGRIASAHAQASAPVPSPSRSAQAGPES